MLAFILLQNFITTEGIILFLLLVTFIIAGLITLVSFIYQSIQKKINLNRLTKLFFGFFIGLFSLSIALIFLIFGGF